MVPYRGNRRANALAAQYGPISINLTIGFEFWSLNDYEDNDETEEPADEARKIDTEDVI